MGGGLAAEVAGRHPGLVRTVVLVDPVNFALQSQNVPRSGVSQCAPTPILLIMTELGFCQCYCAIYLIRAAGSP